MARLTRFQAFSAVGERTVRLPHGGVASGDHLDRAAASGDRVGAGRRPGRGGQYFIHGSIVTPGRGFIYRPGRWG